MTSSTATFASKGKREPAQVLPFVAEGARRPRRPWLNLTQRSADILFFTGIRYERVADSADMPTLRECQRS